jgi:hypothetical protein
MMHTMLKHLAENVTVVHIAYRCGCTRTYGEGDTPKTSCPEHGAPQVSFNRERLKREQLPRAV